jgi:hypothetical protein
MIVSILFLEILDARVLAAHSFPSLGTGIRLNDVVTPVTMFYRTISDCRRSCGCACRHQFCPFWMQHLPAAQLTLPRAATAARSPAATTTHLPAYTSPNCPNRPLSSTWHTRLKRQAPRALRRGGQYHLIRRHCLHLATQWHATCNPCCLQRTRTMMLMSRWEGLLALLRKWGVNGGGASVLPLHLLLLSSYQCPL